MTWPTLSSLPPPACQNCSTPLPGNHDTLPQSFHNTPPTSSLMHTQQKSSSHVPRADLKAATPQVAAAALPVSPPRRQARLGCKGARLAEQTNDINLQRVHPGLPISSNCAGLTRSACGALRPPDCLTLDLSTWQRDLLTGERDDRARATRALSSRLSGHGALGKPVPPSSPRKNKRFTV